MDIKGENNAQLLNRCKNREPNAFRELYELYSKSLFNASLRIVNHTGEAEDILQESFVKAFNDMNRFNTLPEFQSWMHRVVVNHSLDIVRRRKLDLVPLEEDTDTAGTEGEEAENETTNYDIRTVMECVRELPEGYRVILTLFLFEDYSHKEIAGMLNISEGTSKSQYNRARNKLAALIQQKSMIHG